MDTVSNFLSLITVREIGVRETERGRNPKPQKRMKTFLNSISTMTKSNSPSHSTHMQTHSQTHTPQTHTIDIHIANTHNTQITHTHDIQHTANTEHTRDIQNTHNTQKTHTENTHTANT